MKHTLTISLLYLLTVWGCFSQSNSAGLNSDTAYCLKPAELRLVVLAVEDLFGQDRIIEQQNRTIKACFELINLQQDVLLLEQTKVKALKEACKEADNVIAIQNGIITRHEQQNITQRRIMRILLGVSIASTTIMILK